MPKLSIFLPESTQAKLGNPENVSARIAEIIERYNELVRRSKPTLSRAEWQGLFECANKLALPTTGDVTRYLWLEVSDSKPELAQQIGFDKAGLVRKIKTMSYPELLAAVELLQRYWRQSDRQSVASRLTAVLGEEE